MPVCTIAPLQWLVWFENHLGSDFGQRLLNFETAFETEIGAIVGDLILIDPVECRNYFLRKSGDLVRKYCELRSFIIRSNMLL